MWFLTVLFFALAAYNWILLEDSRTARVGPASRKVVVTVLVLLAVGCALSNHQIYLGLGIAPVALFFVWAGSVFQGRVVPGWVRWPALMVLVAAVGGGLAVYPDYRFDMRQAWYGFPVLSLIGSIAGCYLLVLFSRFLARSRTIAAGLSSLGKNSIAIMALHLGVAIPFARLLYVPAPITFVLAILLPYLFALALRRGHWTLQWLYLGRPPERPAWLTWGETTQDQASRTVTARN